MSKHLSRDNNEQNHMFGEQPHKNNHDKTKRHSHFGPQDSEADKGGHDRPKYNRSGYKMLFTRQRIFMTWKRKVNLPVQFIS